MNKRQRKKHIKKKHTTGDIDNDLNKALVEFAVKLMKRQKQAPPEFFTELNARPWDFV